MEGDGGTAKDRTTTRYKSPIFNWTRVEVVV